MSIGLDVRILKRDFSAPLAFPNVRFKPRRYSWNAIGGPEMAMTTAYGNAQGPGSFIAYTLNSTL